MPSAFIPPNMVYASICSRRGVKGVNASIVDDGLSVVLANAVCIVFGCRSHQSEVACLSMVTTLQTSWKQELNM